MNTVNLAPMNSPLPEAPSSYSLVCPWCGQELKPAGDRRLNRCPTCRKTSNYQDPKTNPLLYDALAEDEKQALDQWIDEYLMPAPTAKLGTTYWLKHQYQRMSGRYVFSGALNGALLKRGFAPFSTTGINWMFRMNWRKDPFMPSDESRGFCRCAA